MQVISEDISNTFADITIAGTSAEQTVRPFGLAMTNIIAGATLNPGADTPVGGIFTSAGSDFSATVASVLWDASDDLDNDGILDTGIYADNAIAPGYAWDTTLSVSIIGFEPATDAPGILNNGGILQVEFSAGTFTLQPLPVKSRFGRIKMGNVHGSELIGLAMPMLIEYLNPVGLYVVTVMIIAQLSQPPICPSPPT